MVDYRSLYFQLLGCIVNAVEAIEEGNYDKAKDILVKQMQEAEDKYLDEGETVTENAEVFV